MTSKVSCSKKYDLFKAQIYPSGKKANAFWLKCFHPIILIWAGHVPKALLLETRSTEINGFKLLCKVGFLFFE